MDKSLWTITIGVKSARGDLEESKMESASCNVDLSFSLRVA